MNDYDSKFNEVFENAPDWPTAVSNLRKLTEEIDSPVDQAAKFELLKDTAQETLLALLADKKTEITASHDRYTGGHLSLDAPSFLVFVFRKAFLCYRAELVSTKDLELAEQARLKYKLAREELSQVNTRLPPELRDI